MPLLHVCWGRHRTAKGFIAIGIRAHGIISVGLFSIGILSCGLFSLGVVSFGVLVLGLLAMGSVACGIFALGAIAIGLLALGAVTVGLYTSGALSMGYFAAWGDEVYSNGIAIAQSWAEGDLFSLLEHRISGSPKRPTFYQTEPPILPIKCGNWCWKAHLSASVGWLGYLFICSNQFKILK